MKRIVIGTAGHIDHGKTTLIKALTGIDCDRLKVEKERGITTELGFAHYRFGDDLSVGIVDVPGHEKFVRHMVAGAWGIDMVLLVVAADEGVMPQTREHLDICDLLGLTRGIVAITKTDLVDGDMVELVKEDILDTLKDHPLMGSPIIPVSSQTGENLDTLRAAIKTAAAAIRERSREGIFRLPIDRVFTIRGMGTIVTGTCISGYVRLGEEVEIYPSGTRARVRNIQAYHEDVQEAMAGQRVALNLQGVEHHEISRGSIVGRPDTLTVTSRIDARLRYLKLPLKPVKTDSILRFHVATTQVEARLILLTADAIEPGDTLFAQFVFADPIVVLPGDRFVLRGSYAIQTMGGGAILDIMPGRHKRKNPDLEGLYRLLTGGDMMARAEFHVAKQAFEGLRKERLAVLLGLDGTAATRTIAALEEKGKVRTVGRTIIHGERFRLYRENLLALLFDFQEKNPQKVGMSKEELRTRLPRTDTQVFQAALDASVAEGRVEVDKDKVRIKGAKTTEDPALTALKAKALERLKACGFTPPGFRDFAAELGQSEPYMKDVLQRLVYDGTAVKVGTDMYFHRDTVEELKAQVTAYLKEKNEMTPSDFKTVLNLSRKYMIPLLEYLDTIKLTIRLGDKRVLRR